MPENNDPETKEYIFEDSYEGRSTVKIWCDGRQRCPDSESYRPVYAYSIVTPRWRYDDNDIQGGLNESPNLDKAAQSLFAFLYACQEAKPGNENVDLFPPQVRDWAYHFSEEISSIALQLEAKEM